MTSTTENTDTACEQFLSVRRQTERLCRPLSAEDMMVQSCPEASPAKWHLAHTTWFFETFVLKEFLPGYTEYNPAFRFLFNSYYNAVSDQPEKALRSTFSRPGLDTVFAYRRHIEDRVQRLIESLPSQEVLARITLGINHEQQHQELLVTDIKNALWANPLRPRYLETSFPGHPGSGNRASASWIDYEGGLIDIGSAGAEFAFDNELPRHPEYLQPFQICSRPASCVEFLDFIEDGGYRNAKLWLSEGWSTVRDQGWTAPLYWQKLDGDWTIYTTHGAMPLRDIAQTPVCHVSYFEADAYARWSGKRLPTEAEWENAAESAVVDGNFMESEALHPLAASDRQGRGPDQLFGDVWEWTQSAYLGYPGFRVKPGALGEYNGKFMCNQMVLRGGSAATPQSHIRATYRNFFSPQTRWQFSGIRLAR
jgi:ergothioneine biosynthesis protein EgtB